MLAIVARLSAANWLLVAIGFVTGPLQARALGPTGRGDLAAILLPLNFAPIVLNLGLGTYATREAARKRSLPALAGSVGALLVGVGILAALLSPLVAGLFSGGRPVVYEWVLVGFLLMPLSMGSLFLMDAATGLARWNMIMVVRVLPPLASLVGIAVLYVLGDLTVASAAIVSIVGGLLGVLPTLALLKSIGRPRFERSMAKESLRFGSKAWLGGLGSLANVRLDQILMTRLVAPRELGLYVVAVTISGFFVSPFLSALIGAMLPRFAAGDRELAGRLLRTTLVGVLGLGLGVGLATPIVLPLVYGHAFSSAVPMVWILIVGSIPLAGVSVLSTALTLSGHPGFSAVSELVAVLITVPMLVLVLPNYGGIGAATVSAVAYSVNFSILIIGSRKHLGLSFSDLLRARREDFHLVASMGVAVARRVRPRPAGSQP